LRNKYKNLILIFLAFFIIISVIPSVLAKTRNGYLIDFILDTEIEPNGFSNGISDESEVSLEATAFAIDILDYYGVRLSDVEQVQETLKQNIITILDGDEINLYDLYYLIKSLNLLEYSFESSLLKKISVFINGTQQLDGGFSFSNTSSFVNIISTFYVIQLFRLIDQSIPNITLHQSWVLSCYNGDGGFGGNSNLPSTLTSTYYAVLVLDEFVENLNSLIDLNKTVNYINSLYIMNSADVNNFGGYAPDEIATFALLSSTYFCTKILSLIDEDELNIAATIEWVLDHQNVQDGGFVDNTEAYQQKFSSVTSSYYAFETLKILNPSLSKLKQEIWMVEFNFWILGIVIISLSVVIAISVLMWKKRRI